MIYYLLYPLTDDFRFLNVLRYVPFRVLAEHVFPGLREVPPPYATQRRYEDDAFVDWLIDGAEPFHRRKFGGRGRRR